MKKFNIKEWQNKYLTEGDVIKYKQDGESKEMDSDSAKTMKKDHPAKIEWDKQNQKDQGSDSSGEDVKGASMFNNGDEKTKVKSKAKIEKHTSKKFKKVAIPIMNDMLDDAIDNYDGDFDEWVEHGFPNPPANVDTGLEKLHNISSEEEIEAFEEKALTIIKKYLKDNY